jgi:hypothetical protein
MDRKKKTNDYNGDMEDVRFPDLNVRLFATMLDEPYWSESSS